MKRSDLEPNTKGKGAFGEPWSYHMFARPPFKFQPVHLDDQQRAKYDDDARKVNVEIWNRPDDGVGAGDMVAFTTLRLPEQAEPVAVRICQCINEFAGITEPEGVIDTLRKLLADLEAGRCKPDSVRVRAARSLLKKKGKNS